MPKNINTLSDEEIIKLQYEMQKQTEINVLQSLSDLDAALGVAVSKLVDEGWTLPAKLPISAINALGKTSNIDDVNSFMKVFYLEDDSEKLQSLFHGIQNSKIKSGLIKIVEECWTAYQQQLYVICAISLLTVIEGVLSEFSTNKKKTNMKEVCSEYIASMSENESVIIKNVWNSYEQFISKLYASSNFNDIEPANINRHWLLHGRSSFDVDKVDCIRLFNAIHSLCVIKNNTTK